MKSSLGKQLKRFARNKSEAEEKKDHNLMEHLDVLSQVSQDMKNMRNCCDRLLSAAAATVNSAYEFSESLLEMGSFFMERTTLDDKGECGKALSVLGEVQLELQKLVDHYRAHVIQTITNPSESLLSELRKVEEMKLHCDEKRDIYEHLMKQHSEKGKSKSGKGENFTAQQQLQAAREEYDEATRLCVFRAESLKQGLCRSILTQAARHQTAQLIFFDKGHKSLEAVEPYIRSVAQNQHIDCEVGDVEDGDNVGNSFDPRDDQETSFDNSLSKHEQENTITARNSMEVNFLEHHVDTTMEASGLVGFELDFGKKKNDRFFGRKSQVSSFSAPLYAEKQKEVHLPAPKILAYALPTPSDVKNSTLKLSPETGTSTAGNNHNLWHSSPLNSEKPQKHVSKPRLSSKDTDNKYPSVPLPSPLMGEISPTQIDNPTSYESQKVTRQAFSGPLLSKPSLNKPVFYSSGPIGPTEPPRQSHSGMKSRIKTPQHQQHPTISLPQSVSPPLALSPIISELHELPRPPGVFGHSAPLFNRNREQSSPNKHVLVMSNTGSLLLPPPTLSRSFSNPSRNHGTAAVHVAKLKDSPVREKTEGDVPSPPLTPISLSNMAPTTVSSHYPSAIGRIKVVAGKS